MMIDRKLPDVTRRCVLASGGAVLLVPWQPGEARATPETMAAAMREVFGETKVTPGRVKLDMPQLAENGNSVPLDVSVDSPMTAADHVRSIYVFSEKNPLPNMVRFHLSPRAGRARVQTSVRLAETQSITAVARLSDGSLWSGTAQVIVTISACIDET